MITWESYLDRIVILQVQFETARKALSMFGNHNEMLEQYAANELDEFRKMIHEGAKQFGLDPQSTWAYHEDATAKYLDSTKKAAISTLTDAGKRLQQYEYILRVTVFESFLKEVHRTILKAVPSLLKHDRQIDLGRLVSKSKDVVVHEEIEREVQTLDRESAKKKAEYFLKRLGINWFDGTIIPIL